LVWAHAEVNPQNNATNKVSKKLFFMRLILVL
jgi:hypothetical protein